MKTYEIQYSNINENTWRSMNVPFLELITSVERSSEGASEASDRASEQGEPPWHSTTLFQVQRRFGSLSLGLNSWKHFLLKTFVEIHSNTIHFKYLFKLIETIFASTRFPFLAKTGLCRAQKTYKNTAKINKNRSRASMKTQKTYKNHTKTNKNWSGGRLGVIWAHLGVTWAHLGSSWAHLVSSWPHLGVIWARLRVLLGSS